MASLLLILVAVRLLAPAPADDGLQTRLAEVEPGTVARIRCRVVKTPEMRTQATVCLTVVVNSARFQEDGTWLPLSGERMELHVYTRGRPGCKGDIAQDLPALTTPLAYGCELEARVERTRYAPMRGRLPRTRTYWKNVTLTREAPRRPGMASIMALKFRLLRDYSHGLPDPVCRLAAGAILGNRGPVRTGIYGGQPITRLFARAGIGHVLAVSGLHVGILAAGLALTLRRLGVSKRQCIAPMTLALVGYLLLTGARPATARATLMAVIAIAASAFGGWTALRSLWVGLITSAAVLLAWQPRLLLDPGFQLSYSAVFSLLLLTRPLDHALSRLHTTALLACLACLAGTTVLVARFPRAIWGIRGLTATLIAWRLALRAADAAQRRFPLPGKAPFRRLPAPVRSLVTAQLAIQLGTVVPLGSLYFGRFSTAGTFVNLLAIPLIAVFVQAGILTGVLGMIPWVGPALAWLPRLVTIWSGCIFFRIADLGARLLPCPSVPRPSPLLLCAWYAALVLLLFGRTLWLRLAVRFSSWPWHVTVNPQPKEVPS